MGLRFSNDCGCRPCLRRDLPPAETLPGWLPLAPATAILGVTAHKELLLGSRMLDCQLLLALTSRRPLRPWSGFSLDVY